MKKLNNRENMKNGKHDFLMYGGGGNTGSIGMLDGSSKTALYEQTLPQKNVIHRIAIITTGE